MSGGNIEVVEEVGLWGPDVGSIVAWTQMKVWINLPRHLTQLS